VPRARSRGPVRLSRKACSPLRSRHRRRSLPAARIARARDLQERLRRTGDHPLFRSAAGRALDLCLLILLVAFDLRSCRREGRNRNPYQQEDAAKARIFSLVEGAKVCRRIGQSPCHHRGHYSTVRAGYLGTAGWGPLDVRRIEALHPMGASHNGTSAVPVLACREDVGHRVGTRAAVHADSSRVRVITFYQGPEPRPGPCAESRRVRATRLRSVCLVHSTQSCVQQDLSAPGACRLPGRFAVRIRTS
jgi:hypothetical protein